jgi:transcriptional regulator with XRE-family HTH domain
LKRGRKQTDIDIEKVMQWARAGATQKEIASRLKVDLSTINRRLRKADFRYDYDCAIAELKVSLRTKQVAIALNDKHPAQATMLIWLGKQFLGQREPFRLDGSLEQNLTGKVVVEIVHEDMAPKTIIDVQPCLPSQQSAA